MNRLKIKIGNTDAYYNICEELFKRKFVMFSDRLKDIADIKNHINFEGSKTFYIILGYYKDCYMQFTVTTNFWTPILQYKTVRFKSFLKMVDNGSWDTLNSQ